MEPKIIFIVVWFDGPSWIAHGFRLRCVLNAAMGAALAFWRMCVFLCKNKSSGLAASVALLGVCFGYNSEPIALYCSFSEGCRKKTACRFSSSGVRYFLISRLSDDGAEGNLYRAGFFKKEYSVSIAKFMAVLVYTMDGHVLFLLLGRCIAAAYHWRWRGQIATL